MLMISDPESKFNRMIEFPESDESDWYTRHEDLGDGAFGVVYKALDDRYQLLELKFNDDQPISKEVYFSYQEMRLDVIPPSKEIYLKPVETKEDQRAIAVYLAKHNYTALKKFLRSLVQESLLIPKPIPLSRYNLIQHLMNNQDFASSINRGMPLSHIEPFILQHELRSERPFVALKLLGPSFTLTNDMSQNKIDELIKSAKTEVFALSQTASMCNVYTKNSENVNASLRNTIQFNNSIDIDKFFYKPMGKPGNILPVIDYFKNASNDLGISYPLVEGGDMEQMMKKMLTRFPKPGEGGHDPLSFVPDMTVWYFLWSMAKALQTCKEGHIAHNDIKLENILYDINKGKFFLIDFGLSCHTHTKGLFRTDEDVCNKFAGTPYYIPPETIIQKEEGYASDIWALGICTWELFMGRRYEVPGKTMKDVFNNIMQGAKPDVERARKQESMIGSKEMCDLLQKMFFFNTLDRPTPVDIMNAISKLFGFDLDDVGQYLHDESKDEMDKFLQQPVLRENAELSATVPKKSSKPYVSRNVSDSFQKLMNDLSVGSSSAYSSENVELVQVELDSSSSSSSIGDDIQKRSRQSYTNIFSEAPVYTNLNIAQEPTSSSSSFFSSSSSSTPSFAFMTPKKRRKNQ